MVDPTKLSAEELNKFAVDTGVVSQDSAPTQKRICLGILAHDAKIYSRTHACLMQALVQCGQQGWGFTFIQRDSDSMVARGRSFIASQFLTNPDCASCTDLVFIDTDLAWNADEFIRLCSHPVDVVGGAYPFKDESGNMPLRWPPDGLMEDSTTGLWQVQATTPGFFRVTRKALEKIAREMPWLEFKDNGNAEGQRSWMFFDNLQRPTGVYDEGYVFCEHWRQCGGTVWLDPDLNLTHIGLKAYNHGTIRDWLNRKAETFEKLESEYPGVPPLKLMKAAMGEKIDLKAEQASAA
jgi:hypothetical protein